MTRETQEVILAFLDRNQHTRLGSPQPGEAAAQGVARIKRHPYFAPIPFERLLAAFVLDEQPGAPKLIADKYGQLLDAPLERLAQRRPVRD